MWLVALSSAFDMAAWYFQEILALGLEGQHEKRMASKSSLAKVL